MILKRTDYIIGTTLVLFLTLSATSWSQYKTKLEIMPYIKFDSYPDFIYTTNNITYHSVSIHGKSWGVEIQYKYRLTKNTNIKFGLGYFRYSFNDIESINRIGQKSTTRPIDDYIPPNGVVPGLAFQTDQYWYNTISILLGIEKSIQLPSNWGVSVGGNIRNFITFSQNYHITQPSPEGDNFHRKGKRYFGFSPELYSTIYKTIKKISVGPSFLVPIYSVWKTDVVFPSESNSGSRSKWFGGVGFGVSVEYTF